MGFLGRAKKIMGGKPASEPPRPQYYSVLCVEGHTIRGQRTEGYHAIRCPECGEGVFILPRSPLPMPAAPSSSAKPRRPVAARPVMDEPIEFDDAPPQMEADEVEEIAEIEWVDAEAEIEVEPEPELKPAPVAKVEPPRPAKAAPPKAAPSTPRPRKPRPRPADPAPVPAAVEDVEPIPSTSKSKAAPLVLVRPRKSRTNLYLLAAVVVLVLGTVAFRVWKSRRGDLPHIAQVNFDEGQAALEMGKFDEARGKLDRAARAFDSLGATDETSEKARNLAAEAFIYANLDHRLPSEIVEEVARLGEVDGVSKFETLHAGYTVIIDSEVDDEMPLLKNGSPNLSYRILVGSGPQPAKTGRIDLSGLRILEGTSVEKGRSILLGAKYKSIRLEGDEWWITLEPNSGVFLNNSKALQKIFLNSGEPAR